MSIKPKIKAGDAVRDIRSGMSDSELMDKYGISAKGLQSLITKLLEAKAITSAELARRRASYHDTTVIQQMDEQNIIQDIREGMSDSLLMIKYTLSSDGLRRILQTLLDANAITVEELYGTSTSTHDTVFVENLREMPRQHLAIAVDIYESQYPEIIGTIDNVSEKGIGTTGIAARIGEIKSLVIPSGNFIEADSVMFEARCQWVKEEDTGELLAGFEITSVSQKNLSNLRRLIKSLPFLG